MVTKGSEAKQSRGLKAAYSAPAHDLLDQHPIVAEVAVSTDEVRIEAIVGLGGEVQPPIGPEKQPVPTIVNHCQPVCTS